MKIKLGDPSKTQIHP